MKTSMKAMKKVNAKTLKAMADKEDETSSEVSAEEEEEASSSAEGSDEESDEGEGDSGDEEESDEEEDVKAAPSVRQEANAAKRNVDRGLRIIKRLESKNQVLAKKMKENKDAIRKIEKEMEEAKSVLASKRRVLNREKNAKVQAQEEKKAARAARIRRIANKKLKAANKRLAAMGKGMRGIKGSAEDAHTALKRAQSKVDECMRTIKDLKAKGERVPEDLRDDYSSPHAWKPPGYHAAKALAQAKEVLAKAQNVHKQASAKFEGKNEKRKAFLEKVEEVKRMRKAASDLKKDTVSGAASPSPHRSAKLSKTMKSSLKKSKTSR